MHITLTHSTDTNIKLAIAATEAELKLVKEQVLESFQKSVRIPGFREGKAPLPMVEKSLDTTRLQTEFLDAAINQMYFQAIQDKQVRTVDNPEVSIVKFVPYTVLEFTADVEALGEVTLPDYKKIKLDKPAVKVTQDDIKGVIESLRQRIAEKKDVERGVAAGDVAWIDFVGTDTTGQPIQGADGKNYPLPIGSDTFIPGFEDNIIGMKSGDEKTFTLTFPKDYGVKALANKKVSFAVTVTKVQEVILPPVNDDFAAKAGPFKTVEELKADIKQQLTYEKQNEADRQYENDIVQAIAEKTVVAIPKTLIDSQIDRMEQDERQNLAYRGQTWEEHLQEEGVTAEEHKEQKRPQAEAHVRAGLALAEIADKEHIDVTPEELDNRIATLRVQYPDKQMQAELAKPEARRDIASRMMTEKTLLFLTGK